jgi:nicotinamidase-related amidase
MRAALLVIDMLNTYEHEDAEPLKRSVANVVPHLVELIEHAKSEDFLTVYVNDNYGDWAAGRQEIAEAAMCGAAPSLIEPLLPADGTPFVVKARHSIFYQTQVEYLLRQEGIERLVLTGQVTEQCSSTRRSTLTSATSRRPSRATRSRTSTRASPRRRCG